MLVADRAFLANHARVLCLGHNPGPSRVRPRPEGAIERPITGRLTRLNTQTEKLDPSLSRQTRSAWRTPFRTLTCAGCPGPNLRLPQHQGPDPQRSTRFEFQLS